MSPNLELVLDLFRFPICDVPNCNKTFPVMTGTGSREMQSKEDGYPDQTWTNRDENFPHINSIPATTGIGSGRGSRQPQSQGKMHKKALFLYSIKMLGYCPTFQGPWGAAHGPWGPQSGAPGLLLRLPLGTRGPSGAVGVKGKQEESA